MAATTIEASFAYSQNEPRVRALHALDMLNAAGFDIITAEYRHAVYGAYTCVNGYPANRNDGVDVATGGRRTCRHGR